MHKDALIFMLNLEHCIPYWFVCVCSQLKPEQCLQLHREQIHDPVNSLLQERMTTAAFKSFDILMKVRIYLNRNQVLIKVFMHMDTYPSDITKIYVYPFDF